MTAGPTGPLGMTPAGMKVTGAADRNRGSRVGTGMTNKLGFSARLVALVLLSLAAGDQARAGGGVVAVPPPPISLTASDGSGLELVSLTADVAIDDPLAFTELHLAFRNPESRVREGRFRITLPSGAIISRFAMRIGERWQEGEIVEQQAAHHKQDPALLEAEAGNEFSARVFPIPAAATKEIVISYAQELTRTGEPYRLPLRGLPRLGMVAVRALSGGAETRLERRDFVPDRDFELPHTVPGGRLGLRDDNLVVARVVPLADTTAREEIGQLHVLVDTSASRALGLADEAAGLERLLGELAKKTQVLFFTHHEHLLEVARKALGAPISGVTLPVAASPPPPR